MPAWNQGLREPARGTFRHGDREHNSQYIGTDQGHCWRLCALVGQEESNQI